MESSRNYGFFAKLHRHIIKGGQNGVKSQLPILVTNIYRNYKGGAKWSQVATGTNSKHLCRIL